MRPKKLYCLALILGLSSCKTTSNNSETQVVTDFGVNDKLLQNEIFPGDSRTERRNSWWIDNNKYKKSLFAEFGGPDQVIDGKSEKVIADEAISFANRGQQELNGGKHLRAFHAKSQACLSGKMYILKSVLENEELQYGVFAANKDGSLPVYDVLGRYSNGNGKSQSDAVSDPRGFAVKVLNVKASKVVPDMPEPLAPKDAESMNQDFLGTNSPVFPNRNAKSYADFHLKTLEGQSSSLVLPAYLLNPFTYDGFRTAAILAKFIDNDIGSLAEITYGSGGAFKMGKRAGKYWLRGCADEKDKTGKLYPRTLKPKNPSDDYLEDELETRMSERGEVCMEVLVQVQRHPILHPIEDPSVIWKDIPSSVSYNELLSYYKELGINPPPADRIRSAAFYPVARILMPKDANPNFRSAENKAQCEGMFFNTWHTSPDHRPLGNINRVRLQVYRQSWLFRQKAK